MKTKPICHSDNKKRQQNTRKNKINKKVNHYDKNKEINLLSKFKQNG